VLPRPLATCFLIGLGLGGQAAWCWYRRRPHRLV